MQPCPLCGGQAGDLDPPLGVIQEKISRWPHDLKEAFVNLAPESGPLLWYHLNHSSASICSSLQSFATADAEEIINHIKDIRYAEQYVEIAVTVRSAIAELLEDPWVERHPRSAKRRLVEGRHILGGRDQVCFTTITGDRPPGLLWIEVLARRDTQISGWHLDRILHEVFEESSTIRAQNRTIPGMPPRPPLFTFKERCQASGADHLQSLYIQDKELNHDQRPQWSRPPRENIRITRDRHRSGRDRRATDHPAYREHRYLAVENGIRRELASISRSWPGYGSAWRAWASFCDSMYPMSPHFPADPWTIRAFAANFRNPDTLKQYLGHLRFAHHLLDMDPSPFTAAVTRIIRGSCIGHLRKPKGRIVAAEIKKLIRRLAEKGEIVLARFLAINRQYLFRVNDESRPLQIDGRSGIPEHDPSWHSQIHVSMDKKSVRIRLRSRKNERNGCTISRRCCCGSQGLLLCGVCSLIGQIKEHISQGRSDRQPIFMDLNLVHARNQIRETAAEIGLSEIEEFTWHFIRRGMATDLLRHGSSLAQILVAGGWRSSAFLRYLLRHDLDEREAADLCIDQSDSDPEYVA
jgi:hypothetical protein